MADEAAKFVNSWMGQNVHHHPFPDQWDDHVEDLKAQLLRDLDTAGFSGEDVDAEMDLRDMLKEQLEAIYDPDLGFHDPD